MVHLLACGAFPPGFVLMVCSPFILLGAGLFWLLAIGVSSACAGVRAPRVADGHCLECGYDLRATPERCPECGTEAPTWVSAGQLMATEGAWESFGATAVGE